MANTAVVAAPAVAVAVAVAELRPTDTVGEFVVDLRWIEALVVGLDAIAVVADVAAVASSVLAFAVDAAAPARRCVRLPPSPFFSAFLPLAPIFPLVSCLAVF